MLSTLEQKRIRDLITETVTMLCQNSLTFRSKFTVEGLLGITIDDKDVFLINIHEVISSRPSVFEEKLVSLDSLYDSENNTLSESCVLSPYSQSSKTQPAMPTSLPLNDHSKAHPPSRSTLPCDQLDDEIVHLFNHRAFQSGKLLPAGEKTLENSLLLSAVTGDSELLSSTSTKGSELQDNIASVKEEITSDSETDASDSRLNCASQDLCMECNSVWPEKQDTYGKV